MEEVNNDYTNNCMNMEFVLKHLKQGPLIKKLGIKNFLNEEDTQNPINENDYENFKEDL